MNNQLLKERLASYHSLSQLSSASRRVLEQSCRLGNDSWLSASRIFSLLSALDDLTYDNIKARVNRLRDALGDPLYSERMVYYYQAACCRAAKQLAHLEALPVQEFSSGSSSSTSFKLKTNERRVYIVCKNMLNEKQSYLIVSMEQLKQKLRLQSRTIRTALQTLDRQGYILCLGGSEGANYSITFKRSLNQPNTPTNSMNLLQAA